MRDTRILVCAVFGASLLAVQAACGASPFAEAMNKVCRTANLRVANVGVSQSLYELDANEPRLLAADKAKAAALVKLGKAPRGEATPFATYLVLQQKVVGLEGKIVTAAKRIHLSTVEQLQAELGVVQTKQDAAARKIGVPACLSTAV